MERKSCPQCGGPLEPPDDFCQRCLDAEMKARARAGRGYADGVRWYQRSATLLLAAAGLYLLQIVQFESCTRADQRRKVAATKARLPNQGRDLEECMTRQKGIALALLEAEARSEGLPFDPQEQEATAESRARPVCEEDVVFYLDPASDPREVLKSLRAAPRVFYGGVGVNIAALLLLALWARWRPVLPAALAAGLGATTFLTVAVLDTSGLAWVSSAGLIIAALICTLVAIGLGVRYSRT